MRDIDLSYEKGRFERKLVLTVDNKPYTAIATTDAAEDMEELRGVNIMKELIRELVSLTKEKVKDITEDEQDKIDDLVLEWIRTNAPPADNMTIIRGKKA